MTEREVDIRILTWGLAHAMASENPQGLIDGTMTSEEAGQRMAELAKAETALFDIPPESSPEPLNRWRIVRADKGCSRCWISSRRKKDHPECEAKIREWFAAREALAEWVESGVRLVKEGAN